jgi:hypothetical protein
VVETERKRGRQKGKRQRKRYIGEGTEKKRPRGRDI